MVLMGQTDRCKRLKKTCVFQAVERKIPIEQQLQQRIFVLEGSIRDIQRHSPSLPATSSKQNLNYDREASSFTPPQGAQSVSGSPSSSSSTPPTSRTSLSSPKEIKPVQNLLDHPFLSLCRQQGRPESARFRFVPPKRTHIPIYNFPIGVYGFDRTIIPPGSISQKPLIEGYRTNIRTESLMHSLQAWNPANNEEVPLNLATHLLVFSYFFLPFISIPDSFGLLSIQVFIPIRTHFHFYLPILEFMRDVSLPASHPSAIHPSLLNAIFLAAVQASSSPSSTDAGPSGEPTQLSKYEAIFLARTRSHLSSSLAYADRLHHHSWASIILAVYFGRGGRQRESHSMVSTASRFVHGMGIGLGKSGPDVQQSDIEANKLIAYALWILDANIRVLFDEPFQTPEEVRHLYANDTFLDLLISAMGNPLTGSLRNSRPIYRSSRS